MTDSLVLANQVELIGAPGGVPSVNPLCPGAIFKLAYSDSGVAGSTSSGAAFDLGAPQPTTDFVASLILDGERPFGRRASNRTITLPVIITAPTRLILAAAREVLEQAVDQDVWTITWTKDPAGGTPLPLIIDCFRAQPSVPVYNLIAEERAFTMQLELTIPALPYGRSDQQQQISFAAPVPASPPAPPAPIVLDSFTTISSPSGQCQQSGQCVIGPWTCCWDPDLFGDPGGQVTPFTYGAALPTTVNLTGMTSLQMWMGFGTRYYPSLEYHGRTSVSVFVTLTDTSGNTLAFSRSGMRLPVTPSFSSPVFSRVSMHIPQTSTTFNYESVGSYSFTVLNRQSPVRRLSWVTAYVDTLTVFPTSQTVSQVTRGALYTLYGLVGTARTPCSLAFQQPPTAGTPTTVSTAGVGNYTVPANTAWLKVEGVGGGGAGASLSGTGNGAGGGGAAYSAEPVFPCTPGQVIPYNVGLGGTAGATPVNGQPTVFGPGPAGQLVVTAPGGISAAYNSPVGGLGGAASGNVISFPGGQGRTASGAVGGGGAGSGGSSSAGLTPMGSSAAIFATPGSFSGGTGWLCPAGVTQVYVQVWGSGGSGAVGSNYNNGGGGGGGEYAAGYVNVTPGTYYSFVVAAGGASVSSSGANGLPGASSSFTGDSGTITAHGGTGGISTSGTGGQGTGGSGSTATVHFPGGAGGSASPYSGSGGSSAGSAAAGNAGNGYGVVTPAPTSGGQGGAGSGASNSAGQPGNQPGGGGGGTWDVEATGAGGAGMIQLTYPGGAPTSNGAAAVTGGGAGGAGGGSANTAGSAGSQPGGAGGGACSTGTAEAGGAGAAGNLKITPYTSAAFKSLIVHRPPLGAIKNLQPLVSVGGGTGVPNGTSQYQMPQPLSGINADFGGTYTILLINASWSGTAARTIFVTVYQYEYAGGASYSVSTLPVTVTPSQVTNGILTAGVLTLPVKATAPDNTGGYYVVSVTDSNTSDRFYDVLFLDTMGQTTIINEPVNGYINYYMDAPDPNVNIGNIMGSQAGRPNAIGVLDATIMSGGAPVIEPADGDNYLFVYSADAYAPSIACSYFPAWYFDRTQ